MFTINFPFIVILFLLKAVLIIILKKQYHNLKIRHEKKMSFILDHLIEEKKTQITLKNNLQEINTIENCINQKLLKIKIDLISLDFNSREIFKLL